MKAHSDTLMVLLFCLCVSCGSSSAWSAPQTMRLTLPAFEDDSHQYFHELLTDALADIDVTLTIEASSKHYSQRRTVKLLEKGELSAMWLVSSRQRDLLFHRVNVPLTNGLIGKRVLLIPKGAQSLYNRIQFLEDLQKSGLVAGLGVGWFDVTVWQANGLKYLTKDGEWRQLYNMLSNRGGVNYFPRGLNEVVNEAKLNLHLDIEQNLVFEYERDFVFYLSSVDGYQEKLIEEALVKAKKTGLIQKLIDKYWQQDFEHLGLDKRKTIKLVTPK